MNTIKILTGAASACGLLLVTAAPVQAATIRGTDGPDQLTGTRFADTMYGRHGDDVLRSLRGGDEVYGQGEDDRLELGFGADYGNGGGGDDFITGGPGPDVAAAGGGVDTVFGGPGHDTLWSGGGQLTMHGGDGADDIVMEKGSHTTSAGEGNDVVYVVRHAAETAETIHCGPGEDEVRYVTEAWEPGTPDETDVLTGCEEGDADSVMSEGSGGEGPGGVRTPPGPTSAAGREELGRVSSGCACGWCRRGRRAR